MSEQETKREYEAMTELDDAIVTLRESGWTETDIRERVDTLLEDVREDG